MFDQDYSDDLKNEKVIGRINNTFSFTDVSKGGKTYIPFNLIFTQNFIFGERLREPQTLNEGVFNLLPKNIEPLKNYILEGNVTLGNGSKSRTTDAQNKVTIKLEYSKINEITLERFVAALGKFTSFAHTNSVMMSISRKGTMFGAAFDPQFLPVLVSDYTFIFNKDLTPKVLQLLRTIPISDKIRSDL